MAKVCKRGHGYAGYLETCPFCVTTANVKPTDTNVTTNVTGRGFGSGCGRKKAHSSNARRQRAYRERKDA